MTAAGGVAGPAAVRVLVKPGRSDRDHVGYFVNVPELARWAGIQVIGAEAGGAHRADGDLVPRGELGLPRRAEHRLVLQLSEGEVVRDLAENLGEGNPQRAADS